MVNLTFPNAGSVQQQGDAFALDLKVAPVGEEFLQGRIDLGIAGNQPAADRAEKIVSVENPSASRVGMDYSAAGIDQEQPGAQTIEDLGQGRRVAGLLFDRLAATH